MDCGHRLMLNVFKPQQFPSFPISEVRQSPTLLSVNLVLRGLWGDLICKALSPDGHIQSIVIASYSARRAPSQLACCYLHCSHIVVWIGVHTPGQDPLGYRRHSYAQYHRQQDMATEMSKQSCTKGYPSISSK